ncbi:MAG: AMP-binding protein, partial [Candidatus Omnitrophota bacterium]
MPKVSLKDITIIELLIAINRRFSDIPALQIKEGINFKSISYIDLGYRTADTAYNLKMLGVEKGDRVAVFSESRPEWSIAFFGIISCAGIVVPMDIKLSNSEIEFILNDSEAKSIFVSQKLLETILKIKPKLSYLQNIICLDDVSYEEVLLLKNFKVPANKIPHRDIKPEDIALIVYTSGTTGIAKGVQLTYKNLLFEVMSLNELIKFNSKDAFLSILPLNHMLEVTGGLLGPLYVGATITYCESLKPTNILSLMKETNTTVMITVPLVLKMFHNSIIKKINDLPKFKKNFAKGMLRLSEFLLKFKIRIGKLLFSSIHKQFGGNLRCFVSGGAPLDPVVESDFNALGFRILQGYGLTETSPVITVNNFSECKYGSVGKPLPDIEVKILTNSETGDKEGEIITRGPHVMSGYYRNPEKTAEVLRDGWFYTGDIGYFDDDGFLYISGRSKNLIVLGAGKKVFPEEVEEVMSASIYIKEICVLGRISKVGIRKGCEEVYAIVVPNPDSFSKEERENGDLIKSKISQEISRLGENLSGYKRIIDFEIWSEELPKTSTRKIKRKVLLDMMSQKEQKPQEEEYIENIAIKEDELTSVIREIISGITNLNPNKISLQSNLYNDLGVDSLMKVEILTALDQELGITIPENFAYEVNTFSDLVRFTKEYKSGRSGDEIEGREKIDFLIKGNTGTKFSHTAAYFAFKWLFSVYFRKQISGLENLPGKGSFIIAANHSSMLDFPLILTSVPFKNMKDIFIPAAQDYFYVNKYRKTIVEFLFNTFPFERIGDFVKGLKICEELIRQGNSVILFPEGTRSIKGDMHTFKPGLGSLAYNLKVPIVPTYIKGAHEALGKGCILPLPRKIEICFGEIIYPDKLNLDNINTNYEKYTYISNLVFERVKR